MRCQFNWACPHTVESVSKEKRMNTYTITAISTFSEEYTVDAESKEDAIYEVETGGVEPDSTYRESIDEIEVTGVEYGEVEHTVTLGVTSAVRGPIDDEKPIDLLYSLLQQFDGKTISYGDAESALELIGFKEIEKA